MLSITVRWIIKDDAACDICKGINGYEWTFVTPQPLPTELTHPVYGVVWNLAMGSRAHGHARHHCRCNLKMDEPDLSDVQEWAERKLAELEALKT